MKMLLIVAVFATLLISCCVQNSPLGSNEYNYSGDLIRSVYWGFDDQCQHGNASVAYAAVNCPSDWQCEVYVNNFRSSYGQNGLQPCGELVIAENELSQKPDFVTIQSGDKYFYTRRDQNKNLEICCSFIDPTTNDLNRDNQICETTSLEEQCPGVQATGFDRITVYSWQLHFDGTLDMTLYNQLPQDVIIRDLFLGSSSTIYNLLIPAGQVSPNIEIAGGPIGAIGESYSTALSIEYIMPPDTTLTNSTGALVGTYMLPS